MILDRGLVAPNVSPVAFIVSPDAASVSVNVSRKQALFAIPPADVREPLQLGLFAARLDPEAFARAVRGHWGIENRLHWVLDVVFRDDLAQLRSGHAPRAWRWSSTWR
jgi:hypothetical protein